MCIRDSFYTVPGPGEPGHETWAGDSWKTGGAPAWITGSYDPELNLIYWPTGNPSPSNNAVSYTHLDVYKRQALDWAPPDAGPVCFPRMRSGSADDFCARLRAEYDVGVIPGRFFEMPDHFRIGFGGPTEELRAGLERLSQALL